MKLTVLYFIVTLFIASFANNVSAQRERSVVMMFGDSITAGAPNTGGRHDGAVIGTTVLELTDKLNSSQRPALVLNYGHGGTNSSQGLSRLSSAIGDAKNHSGTAYYIMILYGTNDEGYDISRSTTNSNIQEMIRIARLPSNNVTPVIGNLLPRSDRSVGSYNSSIANAASVTNTPLVNFFNAFRNNPFYPNANPLLVLETINGKQILLHPTIEGYEYMASIWYDKVLRSLIEPSVTTILPILQLLLDE